MLRDKGRQVFSQQAQVAYRGPQLQLLKAPTGQLEQHQRVTLGGQQTNGHIGIGALGVLQVQGKTLHATVTARQERGQIVDQTAQRKEQGLVRLDIEIQFQTGVEVIRRQIERQRHGAQPQQTVQVQLHRCGKTPGQGLAGQRHDLSESAQAHTD
ncbi:hypothetical protein D9M71_654250 [compost metagenome]